MAKEPDADNDGIAYVDTTEIAEFINKKSIRDNDNCLMCGSEKSFVVNSEQHIPIMNEENTALRTSYIPVYTTICDNCGFTRNFAKYVFEGKSVL